MRGSPIVDSALWKKKTRTRSGGRGAWERRRGEVAVGRAPRGLAFARPYTNTMQTLWRGSSKEVLGARRAPSPDPLTGLCASEREKKEQNGHQQGVRTLAVDEGPPPARGSVGHWGRQPACFGRVQEGPPTVMSLMGATDARLCMKSRRAPPPRLGSGPSGGNGGPVRPCKVDSPVNAYTYSSYKGPQEA